MIIKRKLYSLAGTRMLAGFNKKILRKPSMAAKRSAVKTQNKVIGAASKGLNKIEGAKTAINQAAINPGGAVSKGVEFAAANPISAVTGVAGKVTMVTNPTGLGLVPIGNIGLAGEVALKKASPKYSRLTKRIAQGYRNSAAPKYVEGGTNGIINSLKSVAL